MPLWLAAVLLGTAIVAGFIRVASAVAGRGQRGGRMGAAAVILVTVGALGLTLHCTAMFDRPLVRALPGGREYAAIVNDLGTASVALYAVPAILVLTGLRRIGAIPLLVLAASLLAVGVTMYDRGPLAAHLAAITVAVVLLSAAVALRTPVRQSGRPAPT